MKLVDAINPRFFNHLKRPTSATLSLRQNDQAGTNTRIFIFTAKCLTQCQQRACGHPGMRAFLHCLREYECQAEKDESKRYGLLNHPLPNGSKTFNTFKVHPWDTVPAHIRGTATAAGAYQIVHTTWASLFNQGLIRLNSNEDMFSPEVQDRLAVILLEGRKALPLIRTGDIEAAVSKLLTEWTSLPGAKENGKRRTAEGKPMDMAYFMSLYNKYLIEEKTKRN